MLFFISELHASSPILKKPFLSAVLFLASQWNVRFVLQTFYWSQWSHSCVSELKTRVPFFISKLNTSLCVSNLFLNVLLDSVFRAVVCLMMFVGTWTYGFSIFAIVIGRELIRRVYVCLCVVWVVCVCTCARRAPVRVRVRVRAHMYMYMYLCTCLSMCMWYV